MAKPCNGCGGPKPAGQGRRFCDTCLPAALEATRQRQLAAWRQRYQRYKQDPEWLEVERERIRERDRRLAQDPAWATARAEKRRARRQANPQADQVIYRRRTYGLEPEDFEAMFRSQQGLCAICTKSLGPGSKTHIDHNHNTGAVRELLCHNCNPLIGHAKESISVLEAAIRYLKKHGAK